MKIFKEIFGRIWALWGAVLFIATMLIAVLFYLVCYLLKSPKSHLAPPCFKNMDGFYLPLIRLPVKVVGAKYFEKIRTMLLFATTAVYGYTHYHTFTTPQ